MNDLASYLASHLATQRGGSVFDPETLHDAGKIIGNLAAALGVAVLSTSDSAWELLGEVLHDHRVEANAPRVKLPPGCRQAVMAGVREVF